MLKSLTLLFFQAEVPLIVDALPMLFHLQDSLKGVVWDEPQNEDDVSDNDSDSSTTSCKTPAVIRIAAHAGVLLTNKYMDLTWDCEIYVISIGDFLHYNFFNLFANTQTSYVSRLEAAMATRLCFIRTVKGNQKDGY
jgi:hypothetical protein